MGKNFSTRIPRHTKSVAKYPSELTRSNYVEPHHQGVISVPSLTFIKQDRLNITIRNLLDIAVSIEWNTTVQLLGQ